MKRFFKKLKNQRYLFSMISDVIQMRLKVYLWISFDTVIHTKSQDFFYTTAIVITFYLWNSCITDLIKLTFQKIDISL